MSEEKTRYESGAAEAELTAAERAADKYAILANCAIHAWMLIPDIAVTLEAAIAAAIRKGVVEERGACARIADESQQICMELVKAGIRWEEETACAWEARTIARTIRARSNPSTPAEE